MSGAGSTPTFACADAWISAVYLSGLHLAASTADSKAAVAVSIQQIITVPILILSYSGILPSFLPTSTTIHPRPKVSSKYNYVQA
jgi:hypothetical protein